MKFKISGAIITAMMLSTSVAGVASAHHQDGHDANAHGMCTAYFSGSENGQGNKRDNGNAFGVFEDGIGDRDDDGDVDSYDVADYCLTATGGFGNPGGGNDPSFGDDTCGFEDEYCDELDGYPGGTGDGSNNGNSGNNGKGGS